jgi:hypothetical protein
MALDPKIAELAIDASHTLAKWLWDKVRAAGDKETAIEALSYALHDLMLAIAFADLANAADRLRTAIQIAELSPTVPRLDPLHRIQWVRKDVDPGATDIDDLEKATKK